jgi:hypothetical protein
MCPGLSEQVEIIFIKWRQISIQKDTARFKDSLKNLPLFGVIW